MDGSFDVIIVGGGIVGLATAYTILKKDNNVKLLLIEKETGVSRHQTGNNSGVIHSGIYYKPGSLKATNCIKGYNMLLDFCDGNEVPYDICGKVIVATDETEIPAMMTLYERGNENGLEGLKILNEEELKALEPYVTGVKGIFVPQTGIIDYKDVSNRIYENVLRLGGKVVFEERLTMIKEEENSVEIRTNKNYYTTDTLITCCGLQADKAAGLNNEDLRIRIIPFRGEY